MVQTLNIDDRDVTGILLGPFESQYPIYTSDVRKFVRMHHVRVQHTIFIGRIVRYETNEKGSHCGWQQPLPRIARDPIGSISDK
jgi:hypothetical protein